MTQERKDEILARLLQALEAALAEPLLTRDKTKEIASAHRVSYKNLVAALECYRQIT